MAILVDEKWRKNIIGVQKIKFKNFRDGSEILSVFMHLSNVFLYYDLNFGDKYQWW